MFKTLANSKDRYCSIEVSARRKFDLDILKQIKFSFISVIWIGKYPKDPPVIEPLALARALIQRGYTILLHIPSRCFTMIQANQCLNYAKKIGVKNILCIRGGGPEAVDEPSCYDFPYPVDMIKYIKNKFGETFEIAVAGYPTLHPESEDLISEMKFMKDKYEAGARYIVTQSVFSYAELKNYMGHLKTNGIKAKVIPGVHIMVSYTDFLLLQKLCKLPMESELSNFIREHMGDDVAIAKYGRDVAMKLAVAIIEDKELMPPHVFTMNEFNIVRTFLQELHR